MTKIFQISYISLFQGSCLRCLLSIFYVRDIVDSIMKNFPQRHSFVVSVAEISRNLQLFALYFMLMILNFLSLQSMDSSLLTLYTLQTKLLAAPSDTYASNFLCTRRSRCACFKNILEHAITTDSIRCLNQKQVFSLYSRYQQKHNPCEKLRLEPRSSTRSVAC